MVWPQLAHADVSSPVMSVTTEIYTFETFFGRDICAYFRWWGTTLTLFMDTTATATTATTTTTTTPPMPSPSDTNSSASNTASASAVPNMAYYSRSRRRKFSRRRMGLKAQSQTRGHDPLDYEQKYSEDARGEEMGLFARIWRIYLDECAIFDAEMIEDWRDGLDVLLIFAGLFSAVVSTFVVQTSQNLQLDFGEVSASLLFELVSIQRAMADGAPADLVPPSSLTPYTPFHPKTLDSWVNGLWFASLSISLSTALVAALAKQWIHQYVSVSSGTPRDRNLLVWHLPTIIGLLPVLMHTALGLFLLGLVIFLIPQTVFRVPSLYPSHLVYIFFAC
ncbi:hypothetical protein EDD18DRAFT_1322417 [Armillaria luteobubalina]|uniref:DUF6535 domain-containing protein n=1 Tax=Armillaria luteobubalina TaxID=153913 RepID=A0AA39PBP7_9AGAR|nr:hypothetical protein EDD18DRAFT_1322417 [Armillaria luteobubalina]